MKRNAFIGAVVIAVCFTAYFFGRAYQSSGLPRVRSVISGAPATTPNAPTDFGGVVYRDLASISFGDLYETLRGAPARNRIQWLQEIVQAPESPRKVEALCGFFRALVQADPQAAADLVINLPRHRGPAMDAMISAAPPSAMPILAEMLLKVPSAARNYQLTDHLSIVIDEWTQVDPRAVIQFLDRHKELPLQQYAESFVQTWAGLDADAARNWLDAHNLSELEYRSWLTGWFRADPQAAKNFAFAHISDKKLGEAIPGLAPELFEQNQVASKQFVERLPTIELRTDALNGIAYLGSSPDYEYSPAVIAKYLIQFPAAEWPEKFGDVLSRWQMVGEKELWDWIAHLPPQIQTEVISHFPKPDSSEPEADLRPVLQLADSNLRARFLRHVVRGMNSETQSAREAIEKLKLPPEQKAELTRFLPKEDKP